MDKDKPMKNTLLAIMVLGTALAQNALADPPPVMQYRGDPVAALDFIASATNHWGGDAASARAVFEGVYGVLRFPLADCDQSAMKDLFCFWADAPIPTVANQEGTNLWLEVKCDGLRALLGSQAVCNDTNCWMAAARVHGLLVEIDRPQWYKFLDLDESLIEERADGTVVINAPAEKRAALGGRPWMTIGTNGVTYVNAPLGSDLEPLGNEAARAIKAKLDSCKQDVRSAFEVFAASGAFAAMDAPTRNALVSNIVETAGLCPADAQSLGLTNVEMPSEE